MVLNSRIVDSAGANSSGPFHLQQATITLALLIAFVLCDRLAPGAQTRQSGTSDFAVLSAEANAARDGNRLDEAIAFYEKALALRPGWTEGWWSLGTIQYDQSAYGEAARAFEKLIELDPKAGTAKVMLGLCEFDLGSDASALKHIEDGKNLGIAKDPQLRQVVLYHEGVLLQRKASFEGAREALEALCRDGVQTDGLTQELGMVALRIQGKPSATDATDAKIVTGLGRASCLAAQGKFDEARQDYGDLVRTYPEYPNIHYAYGKFLLQTHDTTAAVEEFKREIGNNPNHVFARLEIAAVRYRVDSAAGLPYAEEAVKLDPQLPFAHYLFALLLLDTKSYERAIPELEIARRAFPQEAQVYFALGSAYAHTGRKQEAARARAIFVRLNQDETPESSANVYGQEPLGAAQERLDH